MTLRRKLSINVSDILNHYFNISDYEFEEITQKPLNREKKQIAQDLGILLHRKIHEEYNQSIKPIDIPVYYERTIKKNFELLNKIKFFFDSFLDIHNSFVEKNININIEDTLLFGKPDIIYKYRDKIFKNVFKKVCKCSCVSCCLLKKNKPINYFINNEIIECTLDNEEGDLIIVDWKFTNMYPHKKNIKANYEMSEIMFKNAYTKSVIQLNLYRFIFEKKFPERIHKMFIVNINKNNVYEFINVPKIKDEFLLKTIVDFLKTKT